MNDMERRIIVNPDHFNLSTEKLYDMLCKNIKVKSAYEIYSADQAGIQFMNKGKEMHILKEDIIPVLDHIRKNHEFGPKDLHKLELKNQAPMMTFLRDGDVVY
jgi:hypothetical protein